MSTARFLCADAPLAGAAVAIQGISYDGGVSFRAGAAEGPRVVRAVSDSLESWSPAARRDLEDIALHDAGDVVLAGAGPQAVVERIAEATERLAREVPLVVSLGGDHSVSIGTSRGLRRAHTDLGHVVLDAHMDLRPEYDGSPWSHACAVRRMAEDGPVALLGVRSGSREEWAEARGLLLAFTGGLRLPDEARRALEGRPVHLSVDMDVLDPGVLPGTGTPEPGGPGFREVAEALLRIADLRIVAVDLVEVAPPIDSSGASALAAAKLARDLICAFSRV
ncbi:MAG: agmatinase [Acidobacteria bacterium]|nr:agmatinase [Acidobacteriota bacterium]